MLIESNCSRCTHWKCRFKRMVFFNWYNRHRTNIQLIVIRITCLEIRMIALRTISYFDSFSGGNIFETRIFDSNSNLDILQLASHCRRTRSSTRRGTHTRCLKVVCRSKIDRNIQIIVFRDRIDNICNQCYMHTLSINNT